MWRLLLWCDVLRAGEGGDRRWDEMRWDGWMHHWLNGREFEQIPGDGEGQGSLAYAVYGVAKSQTRLSNWTTTALTHKAFSLLVSFPLCQGANLSAHVATVMKNLPANAVKGGAVGLILGWKDSLEEELATCSSILPREISFFLNNFIFFFFLPCRTRRGILVLLLVC